MFKSSWSKVLGGFILGTVGVPLLKSDIAKKAYRYATAGVFIAKDRILEETEVFQAFASDVAEDAKHITEEYYQKKDAQYEAAVEGEDTDAAEENEAAKATETTEE
ncbi:MAG: DUF6110 family protein [Lachnospiraceae bacterium]|nr:DUF6110 family protein [Lachnospiraceae bacterium]